MHRRATNKYKSAKAFSAGAVKRRPINNVGPMRGGIRL